MGQDCPCAIRLPPTNQPEEGKVLFEVAFYCSVTAPRLSLSQQQAMASETLAELTHRGRLSARRAIGRWRPAAGDAGARKAPEGEGDRVGARHEPPRLRTSGTEGGGLRTRMTGTKTTERRRRRRTKSSEQNPAASTPRPGDTSKRSSPRGAFPWGAWLTLPPQTPTWSWLFFFL